MDEALHATPSDCMEVWKYGRMEDGGERRGDVEARKRGRREERDYVLPLTQPGDTKYAIRNNTQPAILPRRLIHTVVLILAAASLAGCEGERVQSMLHPEGPAAQEIATLWWILFGIGTAVFVVTMLALFVGIWLGGKGRERPPLGNRFVVVTGIVLPAIILLVTMYFALAATPKMYVPDNTAVTIEVIGHKWWWEVRYPDHGIITANEIYIPAGRPVRFRLWAADVIHSFWVPQLHGKRDLIPEVINTFWVQADRPGVFRGQCAEYCGLQHARMAFEVIALREEAFDAWLDRYAVPPAAPEDARLIRGRQVFFEAACDNCHAIGGTIAEGRIGPDLTLMGIRRTLGAAQIANNRGTLAGWIANPQAIKPGNMMPPTYLPPEDLEVLVEYLLSLR
jgi:cytochrome c oxidase subunit II